MAAYGAQVAPQPPELGAAQRVAVPETRELVVLIGMQVHGRAPEVRERSQASAGVGDDDDRSCRTRIGRAPVTSAPRRPRRAPPCDGQPRGAPLDAPGTAAPRGVQCNSGMGDLLSFASIRTDGACPVGAAPIERFSV
jgi:hypothetical protein